MIFNGPTLIVGINGVKQSGRHIKKVKDICEKFNLTPNFVKVVNYSELSDESIQFLIDHTDDQSLLDKNYPNSKFAFQSNVIFGANRVERAAYSNLERIIVPRWLRSMM